MSQPAQSKAFRDGDYIVRRGRDDAEQRADAERQLRENGCKAFRFAVEAGILVAHGYVREP